MPEHNPLKFLRSLRRYNAPVPHKIDREEYTRLPEAYKKYWREYFLSEKTPVHYRKDERIWKRLENGTLKRVYTPPIKVMYPVEFHKGLWGGEGIIKGYQKRQLLKKRVPHYWVPTLTESVVYSEVLDKHMSTIVTKRARMLIINNFGLDHYLLKTPSYDLVSSLALRLKRKILLALRDKTLYPDDPEKQVEVYDKYKHYLDAYTHDEIEWYGLTIFEAMNKLNREEAEASKPKPLKILYRYELLNALRNPPPPEESDEDTPKAGWIQKLNPFSSKDKSCIVSSVLNKDIKQFGKAHMFDNNEETCWNSDQGLPQWIQLDFEREEELAQVEIQFQGGFVGQDCVLQFTSENLESSTEPLYPEDVNTLQTFKLSKIYHARNLRITFNRSTDLFGRIVIYKLIVFNK